MVSSLSKNRNIKKTPKYTLRNLPTPGISISEHQCICILKAAPIEGKSTSSGIELEEVEDVQRDTELEDRFC